MRSGWTYLLSTVPGLLAIGGNLLGGWYTLMTTVFCFGILAALDMTLKPNTHKNRIDADWIPDLVLVFVSVVHTLAIGTLVYGIYSGILHGPFVWTAALSTGFNAGACGITVAHELIHRRERHFRNLGLWNLLLTLYTHFYIEHIKGHHKNVGLATDAATARRGESFYRFLARTVPQQWLSAWHIEAAHLAKAGKGAFLPGNFVLRGALVQVALLAAVGVLLGPVVLVAFVVQSIIAIAMLEAANYGEHYGIVRQPDQKVGYEHSWQSDVPSTRFTLVELSRHSDHHMKASKPYHRLESSPESPVLPVGYFGMLYYLLIPPLWFRVMDRRIEVS